jgi:hypothetical protein
LLTGAAAVLSLVGAAGAQAEVVYETVPSVVETVPAYDYAYTAPAPVFTAPAPVVVPAPAYTVAEPRDYVVVTRPEPDYVRPQPRYVPRRHVVINRPVAEEEIVTTGYSAGNCFIDLAGIERCY